MTVAQKVK